MTLANMRTTRYSRNPRIARTLAEFGWVRELNEVWPDATPVQLEHIESCAQAVFDARAAHPDATLADMYNPDNDFLFLDLMAAHSKLDAAVEAAYGVDFDGDEEKTVAHLFKLYAEKTRAER